MKTNPAKPNPEAMAAAIYMTGADARAPTPGLVREVIETYQRLAAKTSDGRAQRYEVEAGSAGHNTRQVSIIHAEEFGHRYPGKTLDEAREEEHRLWRDYERELFVEAPAPCEEFDG